MTQEALPELVLHPVPMRQSPAYRRLVIAGPVTGLAVLGAVVRVLARSARDGIGIMGGVLVIVLLALCAAAWLGLYAWRRSRRRVGYADGRLTVTDHRGRTASVEPTAATAHPVRGSKGGSVLLVVSGTAGQTPVLLRAEQWDWQYLQDRVFRPAGFTIAVASERDSTSRALRAAYPGLQLPFSVGRPVLFTALVTLAVFALIMAVVGLVALPYLTSGSDS